MQLILVAFFLPLHSSLPHTEVIVSDTKKILKPIMGICYTKESKLIQKFEKVTAEHQILPSFCYASGHMVMV